jgi:hypothetical protein
VNSCISDNVWECCDTSPDVLDWLAELESNCPQRALCQYPSDTLVSGFRPANSDACDCGSIAPHLSPHAYAWYCSDRECLLSCEDSYDGNGNSVCIRNTWVGNVSCVLKTCGIPEQASAHVVLTNCTNSNVYRSNCSITCDEGYTPFFSNTTVCSDFGFWQPNIQCNRESRALYVLKVERCELTNL